MDIKDLPIELRKLIKKRQIEQGNDGTFDRSLSNTSKEGNFYWDDTPEGDGFWATLNNYGAATCKKDYPHLYPKSVINNSYQIF